MKTINILMIDENEMMRFYFRDSFWVHSERHEYEISFAADFGQAEKILQQPDAAFDIIFLDLVMHMERKGRIVIDPEGGLRLIEEIRSLPAFQQTKVVVFSSSPAPAVWSKAKKLGADLFLKKEGYLPRELVKWVEKIFKEK